MLAKVEDCDLAGLRTRGVACCTNPYEHTLSSGREVSMSDPEGLRKQLAELEQKIADQETLPLVQIKGPPRTSVKDTILSELYRQREVLLKMTEDRSG
jgi:hypothetical protein